MKRITYIDLQSEIEKKITETIQRDLKSSFYDFDLEDQQIDYLEEKHFHNLINDTIELTGHYLVDTILNRVKTQLNYLNKIEMKIYLYQDDNFNISCFLRKSHLSQSNAFGKVLYIFVSQHFFNSLTEDEQVGIIGHEVAHLIFGHLRFPVKALLSHKLDSHSTWELKANLIYRSKLAEITADLIGLVSNDFNFRAYSSALVKYTSGLDDSANSTFSITPLISLVLKQYDEFAKNPYVHDIISAHPIMPLRVKVINEIVKTKLIRHFGEEVSNQTYTSYKKEFNETLNSLLKPIYPELFLKDNNVEDIIILMSIAVVLADKEIQEPEDKIVKALIKKAHHNYSDVINMVFINPEDLSFDEMIDILIQKSLHISKEETFDDLMLVPIIRKLLIVASSDGEIVKEELTVIYRFAKEFGITKQEIVQIINTQYKI